MEDELPGDKLPAIDQGTYLLAAISRQPLETLTILIQFLTCGILYHTRAYHRPTYCGAKNGLMKCANKW